MFKAQKRLQRLHLPVQPHGCTLAGYSPYEPKDRAAWSPRFVQSELTADILKTQKFHTETRVCISSWETDLSARGLCFPHPELSSSLTEVRLLPPACRSSLHTEVYPQQWGKAQLHGVLPIAFLTIVRRKVKYEWFHGRFIFLKKLRSCCNTYRRENIYILMQMKNLCG